MFRFMDQRGKGKIAKHDFFSAVERMRISLSREDANKVWNYLDTNKNGFIQLQEVSQAYEHKMNNFGGKVQLEVETRASEQYHAENSAK